MKKVKKFKVILANLLGLKICLLSKANGFFWVGSLSYKTTKEVVYSIEFSNFEKSYSTLL